MKSKLNKLLCRRHFQKSAALFASLVTAMVGCLALPVHAAVQVTQFDPPLQISAYAEPSGDAFFIDLSADLDANGQADFHLASGLGGITAVFNGPLRFAQHVAQPDVLGKGGPVAGVPLDSLIGTNIVSSITTNYYVWSAGYTNRDDLTQPLGDHEETIIIANLTPNDPLGPIIGISSNGILLTNTIFPHTPVVSGDIAGREAVMALEFYAGGQRHYGYIHFNFQGGASGVIYGWAYETEPNAPIKAQSLNLHPAQTAADAQLNSGIVGVVDEGTLPGWTVSVATSRGVFVTNMLTEAQGLFRVNLKPGAYRVQSYYVPHAGPGQAVPALVIQGQTKAVTVRRNHFTFLELGSGIQAQPLVGTAR